MNNQIIKRWPVEDFIEAAKYIRREEGLMFGDDWASLMDQAARTECERAELLEALHDVLFAVQS